MKWILVLLVFEFQALALDITTEGLYRATKETCLKVSIADLSNLNADKLRAGYFPSNEFTKIHTFIRSESFKAVVTEFNLTNSISISDYIIVDSGFNRALAECYPKSSGMRKFFSESIIKSDKAGKIVGAVVLVALYRGVGRMFSYTKSHFLKAYHYLKAGNKVIDAMILASLLTSDSVTNKNNFTINRFESGNDRLKLATENILAVKISLKAQIAEEDAKIKSCGQCAELKILKTNRDILQEMLVDSTLTD